VSFLGARGLGEPRRGDESVLCPRPRACNIGQLRKSDRQRIDGNLEWRRIRSPLLYVPQEFAVSKLQYAPPSGHESRCIVTRVFLVLFLRAHLSFLFYCMHCKPSDCPHTLIRAGLMLAVRRQHAVWRWAVSRSLSTHSTGDAWRHSHIISDSKGEYHAERRSGKPLYSSRFTWCLPFHAPGLAPVGDSSGAYHIRSDGSALYPQRYTRTFGFYETRSSVMDGERWFHLDESGGAAYSSFWNWTGVSFYH
jgi:hypothetical protein